jgi:hypothetical protein
VAASLAVFASSVGAHGEEKPGKSSRLGVVEWLVEKVLGEESKELFSDDPTLKDLQAELRRLVQ